MAGRTRYQYFIDAYDFSEILRSFETRDFLEITVDRYGDVVTYRVYGDEENGFEVYVR